jgi:hypothetical protein
MNVRTVIALGALAASAAGFALAPVVRAGDAADEKIAAFKEYLKTNPDSQGIRNQVAELALLKNEKVVEPLMGLLKTSKDDEVKIAVLQAVGKQGVKSVGAKLMAMADSKPFEDKPKLIAAALEGAGDADAAGQYKELMKLAKKYMDSNGDIACAGFRAASLHVTRDTVDDLIKELGRADYTTTSDNAQKRAARGAAKPVLIDILKKITGKGIDDVKVWNEWWGDNKKTWNPPSAADKGKPKDLNSTDTFTDDAYGFEIKKPNKAWAFRKQEGGGAYLTIEASEEGQRAAWIDVFVLGTKNYKEKTPEQYAKSVRENLEGKFRDLKTAEWDKRGMWGGEKSVEHVLIGQHKDFDSIRMHNVFVERSEVVYYAICAYKSGKKASLESDIEEALKTFKITR